MFELLPTILNLLSSYDMFLTERFDRQYQLYEEDEEKYRKEVEDWLKELGEEYPKLKHYVPRALNCILDLVRMQQEVETPEESEDIGGLIQFYEDYCRNWLFLEQTGISYLQVTHNFDLRNDFFKEYGVKLYDYYSDLVFMGLVIIAKCGEIDVGNDETRLMNLKSITAVLNQTETHLEEAKKSLASRTGKTEEYQGYLLQLAEYLNYETSSVCASMGKAAMAEGLCAFAAHIFQRAMIAEKTLAESEETARGQLYHSIRAEYYSSMIDAALGLAWLAKSKSNLNRAKEMIPRKAILEQILSKIGGEHEPFEPKEVENEVDKAIGLVNKAAKSMHVNLDYCKNYDFERPILDQFADELELPQLNTTPLPLE